MIRELGAKILNGRNFLFFIGLKGSREFADFLVPIIVAGIVAPELFGSFALLKMVIFFGTALFVGPLMTPFIVESNKEYARTQRANETFTSVLITMLSSSAVLLAIFLIFGKQLMHFAGIEGTEFVTVAMLAFVGLLLSRFVSSIFLSQDKKNTHVIIEMLFPLLVITNLLFVRYFGSLTLSWIFLGYFFAGIVVCFVSLFFIDFRRISPLHFSKKNFRIITSFSSWVLLGYVSSYLINWGDNIVLRQFVTLEDIGIYNLAYQIFKGGIMVVFAVNIYFTPLVSKNILHKERIRSYLQKKRKTIIIAMLIGIAVSELVARPFIHLAFDEVYYPAITILQVLLIAVGTSIFYAMLTPIFNAMGKYRIIQVLLIIQVTLNLLLDFLLVPSMGAMGAAVGTVVSYVFFTLVMNIYFNKKILPHFVESSPAP